MEINEVMLLFGYVRQNSETTFYFLLVNYSSSTVRSRFTLFTSGYLAKVDTSS